MIGDFNRHIGDIIEGNEDGKVSFGGHLVRDLIDTGNYCLVNATEKVIGGPYTRYDPSDPHNDEKKSVLELCIISKELFIHVDSLTIDKDRLFTPFRTISKTKLVFTDHYSLKLVFKNIPMKPTKEVAVRKVIRWNTNKECGWAAYTEMTTKNAKLEAIAEVTNIDADTMMKKIDNELNNIKFKVFGKAKDKNKVTVSKEIESLQKEKVELCLLNDTRRDNAFNFMKILFILEKVL